VFYSADLGFFRINEAIAGIVLQDASIVLQGASCLIPKYDFVLFNTKNFELFYIEDLKDETHFSTEQN